MQQFVLLHLGQNVAYVLALAQVGKDFLKPAPGLAGAQASGGGTGVYNGSLVVYLNQYRVFDFESQLYHSSCFLSGRVSSAFNRRVGTGVLGPQYP